MCRFLAYTGNPVILNDLLYEPEHSLINQSYQAEEMEEPLNGDGFGVGWYARDLDPDPALFRSVSPAWNNRNLKYLSPRIASDCVFAHIRAASVGDVTELNCHPFNYNNYLMMHNGGIDDFEEIKRPLIEKLSDKRFDWLQGQTDSEHIFALFLDNLLKRSQDPEPADFCDAFRETFEILEQLKNKYGIPGMSYLNLLATDGDIIVGSRFVTDSDKTPLSLHHSEGKKYQCNDGDCYMTETDKHHERAILVVSETLTEKDEDWNDVPENNFVIVDENLDVEFDPISF
ncbi:MAG TPA: class II glutamine amidotransferase [Balneolaceae bacterium]|nr:class II glutamine amidotransferase [Balneolaceae bacterium]